MQDETVLPNETVLAINKSLATVWSRLNALERLVAERDSGHGDGKPPEAPEEVRYMVVKPMRQPGHWGGWSTPLWSANVIAESRGASVVLATLYAKTESGAWHFATLAKDALRDSRVLQAWEMVP